MMKKVFPVHIHGSGLVTAQGFDPLTIYQAQLEGLSAIKELPNFERRGRHISVGQVDRPLLEEGLGFLGEKNLFSEEMITTKLALYAAHKAILSAPPNFDRTRTAIFVASSLHNVNFITMQQQMVFQTGRASLRCSVNGMPSYISTQISKYFQITGPAITLSSSCGSPFQAITIARSMMETGLIDHAIIVAADAAINPIYLEHWIDLRLLSSKINGPNAIRPFCKTRDGFAIGEGAAALFISKFEGPSPIKILGESHQIEPGCDLAISSSTIVKTIDLLLKEQNTKPDEIRFVHASASGALLGDREEGIALAHFFQNETPIWASKAMYGNAFAASGLINLIHSMTAIMQGRIPRNVTIIEEDQDIGSEINIFYPETIIKQGKVLVNIVGLGGITSALLIEKEMI